MTDGPFDLDEIDETIENNRLSDKIDKLSASLMTFAQGMDNLCGFLKSNYEIARELRDYQKQTVEMEERKTSEQSATASAVITDAIEKATDKCITRIRSETDAACERLKKAEGRYSLPSFGFSVILSALIWLSGFLCVIIYANTVCFHLSEITSLISIFLGSFILTVLLLYLSHRYDK